jgi:hypothetical protein
MPMSPERSCKGRVVRRLASITSMAPSLWQVNLPHNLTSMFPIFFGTCGDGQLTHGVRTVELAVGPGWRATDCSRTDNLLDLGGEWLCGWVDKCCGRGIWTVGLHVDSSSFECRGLLVSYLTRPGEVCGSASTIIVVYSIKGWSFGLGMLILILVGLGELVFGRSLVICRFNVVRFCLPFCFLVATNS